MSNFIACHKVAPEQNSVSQETVAQRWMLHGEVSMVRLKANQVLIQCFDTAGWPVGSSDLQA